MWTDKDGGVKDVAAIRIATNVKDVTTDGFTCTIDRWHDNERVFAVQIPWTAVGQRQPNGEQIETVPLHVAGKE